MGKHIKFTTPWQQTQQLPNNNTAGTHLVNLFFQKLTCFVSLKHFYSNDPNLVYFLVNIPNLKGTSPISNDARKYHCMYSLVEDLPHDLEGGAVEVAPVSVQVHHRHVPLAHVQVNRKLRPLQVETLDWGEERNTWISTGGRRSLTGCDSQRSHVVVTQRKLM